MLRLPIVGSVRRTVLIRTSMVTAVVLAVIIVIAGPVLHLFGFAGPNVRGVFLSAAPHFAPDAACGAVARWKSVDGVGFPAVNTNNCGKQPAQNVSANDWNAIRIGAATCQDWVIYHTNQTSQWELFRSGVPGQSGTDINLTHSGGDNVNNVEPSLSPDRQWMAYASNRDGTWQIYAASTDGKQNVAVTTDAEQINVSPIWSPDGSALIYESARNGSWNLYRFNVQTGQEDQITDSPSSDIDAYWSPDSQYIIFDSQRSGLWQIYKLDLASTQVKALTQDGGNDYNPIVSPDGKLIVFRAYTSDNPKDSVLYVMNVDGTNAHPVSDPKSNATAQIWSPDGSLLAYQSDKNGLSDIYVYQLSSGKTRQVTRSLDNAAHYAPTWSCDGKSIIFTSDVTQSPNLYSVPALPMDAP